MELGVQEGQNDLVHRTEFWGKLQREKALGICQGSSSLQLSDNKSMLIKKALDTREKNNPKK